MSNTFNLAKDHDVQQAIADAEKEKEQKKHDEEEQRNKTRWRRSKETMREWGALSSCHGVPHIAEASSHLALLIWTLILVASFVTFAILFSDTLIQYLKYGKLVVLQMDYTEIEFPSVTICNINPYKYSSISGNPELEALTEIYNNVATGQA
uniref:Uncharacterized protein n=1 Tax=Acrobeloides nanus TaxID=290746 RepID=A0A914BZ27_9BILA